MARALQVSIDQLAELLTESENADTTGALSAGTAMTMSVLLPQAQSEVRLGRPEFEDLVRSQVAETDEALRSAGIGTTGADVGPDTPVQTTLGARLRRFTRFTPAAVIALVFAAGVASVPLIASHRGPLPRATGIPAPATPVAAVPGPEPADNNSSRGKDSTGAVLTAPAASNTPTDGTAPPGAAAAPAHHATRTDYQTISRSTLLTSATTPTRPRTPVIPAEVCRSCPDGIGRITLPRW